MPRNFFPIATENDINFYELISEGVVKTTTQSSNFGEEQVISEESKILNYVKQQPAVFVPRCITSTLAVMVLEDNAPEFCLNLLIRLVQQYKAVAALLINNDEAILDSLIRALDFDLKPLVSNLIDLIVSCFNAGKRELYIPQLVEFCKRFKLFSPWCDIEESKQIDYEPDESFINIYSQLLQLETDLFMETKSEQEAQEEFDEISNKFKTAKVISELKDFIISKFDRLQSVIVSMKETTEDPSIEDIEKNQGEQDFIDFNFEENLDSPTFYSDTDTLKNIGGITPIEMYKPKSNSCDLSEELKKLSNEFVECNSKLLYSARNLKKHISSFLNTKGGKIYFGVEKTTKDIVGLDDKEIDLAQLEQDIDQVLIEMDVPSGTRKGIKPRKLEISKLCVIEISIPQEKQKIYLNEENKFYVRTEKGIFKVSQEKKEESLAVIKNRCSEQSLEFLHLEQSGGSFISTH